MKQYCRYCAFCLERDGYLCIAGDIPRTRTESQIRHSNDCKAFADCGLDIFTGEPRRPVKRKEVTLHKEDGIQLTIFDEGLSI